MKLLIDHADPEAIRTVYAYYPVSGVTTNPSILAACGRLPFEVLKEIRSIIHDDDLHVQATALTAEGMVRDAERIVSELGPATFVKIPCIREGYRAMKMLKEKGIRVTGTAVYTPMQAYLAAMAGARYVAPYVNRIDNLGYDSEHVCREIQEILLHSGTECGILAASFHNSRQMLNMARLGCEAATASPSIIEGLVTNGAVDAAVDAFCSDFEKLTGKKNMSDL